MTRQFGAEIDAARRLDVAEVLACEGGQLRRGMRSLANFRLGDPDHRATEIAVHAFLNGRLGFLGIAEVIQGTLDELPGEPIRAFETLYAADREAREVAAELVASRA